MTATIEATATRDPAELSTAVLLLLDNQEIEALDILWRFPSGSVFVGPLPEPLMADCEPIGYVNYWISLLQP